MAEYVYATLLPTGVIKIGKGSNNRATSAQTFFHEKVIVLKKWPMNNCGVSERAAHRACEKYKLNGGGFELFKGPPDEIIKTIESGFKENINDDWETEALDFFSHVYPERWKAFERVLSCERWGENTCYAGTYSEKTLLGFHYPYHLFKKNKKILKKHLDANAFHHIELIIQAGVRAVREVYEITKWFDTWEVGPRRSYAHWINTNRYERNYAYVMKSDPHNEFATLLTEERYGVCYSTIIQRLSHFSLSDRLRVYKWWKQIRDDQPTSNKWAI